MLNLITRTKKFIHLGIKHELQRRTREWLGRVVGTVMLVALWLAVPTSAAACSRWNPVCWGEELGDFLEELVGGSLELAWDVITLNPEEFFEDFTDIAYNVICGGLTPLSLAVSAGIEEDFDECESLSHPIEPNILAEIGLYFNSSFDSVQIHENCNLDGDYTPGDRAAITFGEHIYFEPGVYDPTDNEGFALLAHELLHVLQYRKKGIADFTCEYGLNCAFGANRSCKIEQEAEDFEALVWQDQQYTPDGDFSNNECQIGETRHSSCPSNRTGDGYDYECDNGNWIMVGGWCDPEPTDPEPIDCGPASNPANCHEQ